MYLIVEDLAGDIPDHDPALELVEAHGEVAALDEDLGAAVDRPAERLDDVDAGLGADVRLADRTLLRELTPRPTPHTP